MLAGGLHVGREGWPGGEMLVDCHMSTGSQENAGWPHVLVGGTTQSAWWPRGKMKIFSALGHLARPRCPT